jgi:hypothetical protein
VVVDGDCIVDVVCGVVVVGTADVVVVILFVVVDGDCIVDVVCGVVVVGTADVVVVI